MLTSIKAELETMTTPITINLSTSRNILFFDLSFSAMPILEILAKYKKPNNY
jgi:hypothetical protein